MKELTGLSEKLAEKLGTTVEHLWEVTVKQTKIVYYEYLAYTILTLLFIIIAIWVIDFSLTGLANLPDGYGNADEEAIYSVGIIFSTIVIIVSPFFLIANIKELITLKQNPEYWALSNILGKLD